MNDIQKAMKWYTGLKTEDLSKVYPHVNEMDSQTIVNYWADKIKDKE